LIQHFSVGHEEAPTSEGGRYNGQDETS